MAQAAQSPPLPPVRKQPPADGKSQASQPEAATEKRGGRKAGRKPGCTRTVWAICAVGRTSDSGRLLVRPAFFNLRLDMASIPRAFHFRCAPDSYVRASR